MGVKIGFLLHVYHLETVGWEDMVWGKTDRNELGTVTKLAECLLDVPTEDETVAIVYSGPSERDGLSEGAYTKQYLLDRLERLADFPRLRTRLERLTAADYNAFAERVKGMVVGPRIQNTAAELEMATVYFAAERADRVIQIAAATHAPRCLRNQLAARYRGSIAPEQIWLTAPADIGYVGISPDEVVIAEPIHRRDNPLYDYHPSWVDVTKRYPHLSLESKKVLLGEMDALTARLLAEQPANTPMAN